LVRKELWPKIRACIDLIWAHEVRGVLVVHVVETDLFPPKYPYGLTKDTGIVKIQFEEEGIKKELIKSLENLIWYKTEYYQNLRKLWNQLVKRRGEMEKAKHKFLELVKELKEM